MNLDDFVLEALSTVLLHGDIPDDAYPVAVSAQACHLAGVEADQLG